MLSRPYILSHTFSENASSTTCQSPIFQHQEKDCGKCEWYSDCACLNKKLNDTDKAAQAESSKEINKEIRTGVVVVLFYADFSKKSLDILPIMDEIAAESKAKVIKVDVTKNLQVAKDKEVRFIPEVIVFKNGNEQARFVGAKTKDEILKQVVKCF